MALLEGGAPPSAFKKTNKSKIIKGKSYTIYQLGKWKYVRPGNNGNFITLSTFLKRNGIKPY